MNMPDSLEPSYGNRKRSIAPPQPLLSLVRTQKLDLLVHLLANLQQILVVTGPKGIGKTTLALTFCSDHRDDWHVHVIDAKAVRSFEAITEQLALQLDLRGPSTLSMLRNFCAQHKVILMVDSAEHLLPGLIDELAQFAEGLPKLRLVFLITQSALASKYNSDEALASSHVIDLPPLTLKQTQQYLHQLAQQPDAPVELIAIDDELVARVHLKTGGVPGQIMSELPNILMQQSRSTLWIGVAAVAVLAGVVWFSLRPQTTVDSLPEPAKESLHQVESPTSRETQQPDPLAVMPPVSEPIAQANPPAPVAQQPVADEAKAPEAKVSPMVDASQSKTEVKPLPVAPVNVDAAKSAVPEVKLEPKPLEAKVDSKPQLKAPQPAPLASSEALPAKEQIKPEAKALEAKPSQPVPSVSPEGPLAKDDIKPAPKSAEAKPESPVIAAKSETTAAAKSEQRTPEVVANVAETKVADKSEPAKPEAKAVDVKTEVKPAVKNDKAEAKRETQIREVLEEAREKLKPVIESAPQASADHTEPHAAWINGQPASHYTLQVMVLSTQAAADRFLRKYSDYGDALKYYPSGSKYVIVYGSFNSAAEAQAFKNDMPREFSQSMVKNFKSIQSAVRR